jgi:predicted DNA-binding transcriptional regulator YafY
MVIFTVLELIRQMDRKIRSKSTGAPEDFARGLGVSVRTLYNYVAMMKEMGAPIRYSYAGHSYEYTEDGHFVISFVKHATSDA